MPSDSPGKIADLILSARLAIRIWASDVAITAGPYLNSKHLIHAASMKVTRCELWVNFDENYLRFFALRALRAA